MNQNTQSVAASKGLAGAQGAPINQFEDNKNQFEGTEGGSSVLEQSN